VAVDRIRPGEYADTLRALGQVFEKTGASCIEIATQEDRWMVASTRGSETLFARYELNELWRGGQLRRGMAAADDSALGEVLRVLGQLLDGMEATSFIICQVPEGFRVTAACPKGDTSRMYSFDEIRALAAEYRQRRRGQSTEILPRPSTPIASATFAHPVSRCPSSRRR
jgi:hypothetical protein